MGRFILRYTGSGNMPDEDVQQIREVPSLTVLDDSSQMLLVRAPEAVVRKLLSSMKSWVCSEERSFEVPNPHPKVLRKPQSVGKD